MYQISKKNIQNCKNTYVCIDRKNDVLTLANSNLIKNNFVNSITTLTL